MSNTNNGKERVESLKKETKQILGVVIAGSIFAIAIFLTILSVYRYSQPAPGACPTKTISGAATITTTVSGETYIEIPPYGFSTTYVLVDCQTTITQTSTFAFRTITETGNVTVTTTTTPGVPNFGGGFSP